MSLWRKALERGLTPGNVVSYLSLQHMRFWGVVMGTLRLRCKALLLGVRLGRGVRAHGAVGLLRWPGSRIDIGDDVSIISSWRRATACTLAAPARLRTFGPDAVISIGPACELSGTSIAVRSTSVTLGRQVLVGPNCVITDADFHAPGPGGFRSSRNLHKGTDAGAAENPAVLLQPRQRPPHRHPAGSELVDQIFFRRQLHPRSQRMTFDPAQQRFIDKMVSVLLHGSLSPCIHI